MRENSVITFTPIGTIHSPFKERKGMPVQPKRGKDIQGTVNVLPEFEEGLSEHGAIYIPFPQAVPLKYSIDEKNCRQLSGEKCGICEKVCPADAVDYDMAEERLEFSVAAVIVTTGYDQLDPSVKTEYCYGELDDVITSMQLERMLSASGPSNGRVYKPSNNEVPGHVLFVQCGDFS